MSTPISYCMVVRATKTEEAYQIFKNAMVGNLKFGSMTQVPCKHDPPCEEMSDEVVAALNAKLSADLEKELPKKLPQLSMHQDPRPKYKRTWK